MLYYIISLLIQNKQAMNSNKIYITQDKCSIAGVPTWIKL